MKTLFEKLKPETLRSLEIESLEYQYTMELLIHTLKSITSYGQLSINDAHRLLSLNRSYSRFDLEELSNLFDE